MAAGFEVTRWNRLVWVHQVVDAAPAGNGLRAVKGPTAIEIHY